MPQFEAELAAKLSGKITRRIAFHPPCTLQHGQQIRGKVEGVLRAAGVDVVLCADSHLCCGSAGTYSVMQPEIAHELRDRKLANLKATGADEIVSANIGCLTHLQSGTDTPVTHWIELVDRALACHGPDRNRRGGKALSGQRLVIRREARKASASLKELGHARHRSTWQ
jgi:glycolate oxidase iron-sulfur subunit